MNAKPGRKLGRGLGALAIAAVALSAAALAGCTNARLVGTWTDPQYRARPIRSALVVSQRKDPVQRRLWEDAVSADLARSGVDAVASYTLYPDGLPNPASLGGALRDRDLDVALVMKPLTATNETRWVPGWSSVEPREYYNPWNGRSRVIYRSRWHRGYPVTDRTLREQLTLWPNDDGAKMVWAGTVEVDNPGSADDLRRDVAKGVPEGLRRAGLL